MPPRPQRFYVDQSLSDRDLIELPAERARQLGGVLRLRPSDRIVLFNGSGFDYPATIEQLTRSRAVVRVGRPAPGIVVPPPEIWLAQALIKADRFDWVVQKATELGVERILPMETKRSVVSLAAGRAGQRVERWRRIAIEASEQCGRARVPIIGEPRGIGEILAAPGSPPAVVLWEDEHRTPLLAAVPVGAPAVLLLVGPEGGFNEGEIEHAREAGAVSATLGSLILRSETAAVAAVAAIRAVTVERDRVPGQDIEVSSE